MAVYSQFWPDARISDDAKYRVIGKWISDRLTDIGWAIVTDSGDIDWTTATRPGTPTANTAGGYEIRKSNDGKTDIYAKFEYGCGYGAGVCMGMWLTVGEGSDGAGTITGDKTTRAQVLGGCGSASPYDTTYHVIGDTSRFCIAGIDGAYDTNGAAFGLQRTTDNAGADTSTGFIFYAFGYLGAVSQYSICQGVEFVAGAGTQDTAPGCSIMRMSRIQNSEKSCLYLPFYYSWNTGYVQLRDVIAGAVNKAVVSEIATYGTTRSFKSIVTTTNSNVWGYTTPSVLSVCVRLD